MNQDKSDQNHNLISGKDCERLIDFWEYLSTHPLVENLPYFTSYWDSWSK